MKIGKLKKKESGNLGQHFSVATAFQHVSHATIGGVRIFFVLGSAHEEPETSFFLTSTRNKFRKKEKVLCNSTNNHNPALFLFLFCFAYTAFYGSRKLRKK